MKKQILFWLIKQWKIIFITDYSEKSEFIYTVLFPKTEHFKGKLKGPKLLHYKIENGDQKLSWICMVRPNSCLQHRNLESRNLDLNEHMISRFMSRDDIQCYVV